MRFVPGVALCGMVALGAMALQRIEWHLLGAAWLESLVLAILLGTALRTVWTPGPRWAPGVTFSSKVLLEIAIVLLGLSVSARTLVAAGPGMLAGIVAVVALAIAASYGVGRLFGLSHRMATLIACGNAICGNSAIAAVAPAIGADGGEVAAAIAFTAALGVGVVLGLPFAMPLLHLTVAQYGALAGLTVYAVPQVLAAAVPAGAVAVQLGTLVKLTRVLMLGPVVMGLCLLSRRAAIVPNGFPLHRLVPWFILGFVAMAALRFVGGVPSALLAPAGAAANALTIVSMAALGLGTDLRALARAGARAMATVTLSLLMLGGISLALIRLLAI